MLDILIHFFFFISNFKNLFQLALQNKFNDTQETPRTPPGAEDAALHQEFMDQIRNFNQNPPTNNAATTARNNNLPAVNILTQR